MLQWFCGIDRLEQVRVPTKSTLERYDKLLPEKEVRALVDRLKCEAAQDGVAPDEAVDEDRARTRAAIQSAASNRLAAGDRLA